MRQKNGWWWRWKCRQVGTCKRYFKRGIVEESCDGLDKRRGQEVPGAVLVLITAQTWHPQGNGYSEADVRKGKFLPW